MFRIKSYLIKTSELEIQMSFTLYFNLSLQSI